MFGRYALSLLLLLTTSALPGYARQRSMSNSVFSIDGTIRDNDDQHGLDKVRVDLNQSAGVPVSTTYTREDGAFEFSGLPNGDYVIQVKVKDYEPLQQTVEIMNGARRGISLFLSKPLIPATSNLNLAISAHQLSAPHKAEDEFEKGMTLLYDKSQYRPAIAQF